MVVIINPLSHPIISCSKVIEEATWRSIVSRSRESPDCSFNIFTPRGKGRKLARENETSQYTQQFYVKMTEMNATQKYCVKYENKNNLVSTLKDPLPPFLIKRHRFSLWHTPLLHCGAVKCLWTSPISSFKDEPGKSKIKYWPT